MRTGFRSLASWAVILSLLGGLTLPLRAAAEPYDPDGVCGPVIVPEHFDQHFEAPISVTPDHCVLCHWWQAMAGASLSVVAHLAPPVGVGQSSLPASPHRAEPTAAGHASPRGPPSIV